jgi:hypothetical protein
MKEDGIMEIKKYKVRVGDGAEEFGYAIDIPQCKGVLSIFSDGEKAVFAKYGEMESEVGVPITNIEEFIQAVVDSEQVLEVSYEVIGTYEES